MKLEVFNIQGEKTGRSVELPADIFGVETNEHAVYLAVKAYLAAQRQGTHKTKEKGEITASTRKIKKQKGTGTARAGSVKSGTMRGGGRMFGPKPRNYRQKLNKKVSRLARKSALSDKAANGGLVIIEDFSFDAPKTKSFTNIVSGLGVAGKKSLFVTAEHEREVYLSARNVQKVAVASASDINTYQIMNANTVFLSEGSIEKIKATF